MATDGQRESETSRGYSANAGQRVLCAWAIGTGVVLRFALLGDPSGAVGEFVAEDILRHSREECHPSLAATLLGI